MKKRRIVEIGAVLIKLFSDETKAATYSKHYSDASFWDKLKRYAKSAGMKVAYAALLLQYLMKSEDVSLKTKLLISAGLGYFILPVDFIPDFAPVIGFADDLGVLLLILGNVANNITPDIKQKAREHLHKWFKQTDEAELDQLEAQIASGKR
ncbi:MAG TPA: hypothetical protein DCL77_12220 [Prolixibacteraceae bacterium]|jgi:uncharacterized membrane protein YkvA (DUF1232 family)|nr:hypothetical protein [Prolixibacteraceae bacterium]